MGRLNIEHLPKPEPDYQISRLPPPEGRRMGFETRRFTCEEVAKRVHSLEAHAEVASHLYTANQARRLAGKLHLASLDGPRTPASSLHMGDFRFRVIGALWKLIEEGPWDPTELVFFTVRPEEWEVTPEELKRITAKQLMGQFRTRLNREDAGEADGFLIAFLHGEFEPTSGSYILHIHGFAAGGMVDVLERLRSWLPDGRLNRTRQPLTDIPYPLGYPFKSFWPCKRIGPVGDDGAIKRTRSGSRIPEPYHSQSLIWLHRQKLSDLGLLMGLRVSRDGFVPTKP